MATIQEIVDNALPGELIYVNNFGYQSVPTFVAYCLSHSIAELPDYEIFYRRVNEIGYGYLQRPLNIDINTRFDALTLKMSSRTELRASSGVGLPAYFFDAESGLIYKKDALDVSTPDDGILCIVSADNVRYKTEKLIELKDAFNVSIGLFKAMQTT